MGSSPSFNPFPGPGRVRCGHCCPGSGIAARSQSCPGRVSGNPAAPHPAGPGWVQCTMEEAGSWSSRAPRTQRGRAKGQERRTAGTMLGAPSPAPCPGARVSAGRGNELSTLIHCLLQDQTWPASRSPGVGGGGGARAGPVGGGCPLGVRVLPGAPGTGGMLLGVGCSLGGMLLGEWSCASPAHPSPGSVLYPLPAAGDRRP